MRKGQIQIQETVFVLIIFFIIILLGMVFFFQVQSANISKIYNDFQEDRFYNIIMWVQDMPELKVPDGLGTKQCIDYYKALSFSDLSEDNKDKYIGDFGNTEIFLKTEEELNREGVKLYSNIPLRFSNVRIINSPVCLYDERDEKHKVAYLEVKWYQ